MHIHTFTYIHTYINIALKFEVGQREGNSHDGIELFEQNAQKQQPDTSLSFV